MTGTITIARRYCGPPDSGNGGYVCGRLAGYVDGTAIVRLHAPPPLDEPLSVRRTRDAVEMHKGDTVIGTARPARIDIEAPPAPTFAQAEAAAQGYVGLRTHRYPTCFVCGPHRGPGDGLRIFAGPLGAGTLVAAPWVPDATLAGANGRIRPEFLWSALDCPGAFSFLGTDGSGALLGELAADVTGSVAVGERCVAVGWEIGRDGRKHYTGTALYSESGACVGVGKAIWFEMPRPHGQ